MLLGRSRIGFTPHSMQISDEQLKEFQEIYENKFGIKLSNIEAHEKAIRLVCLIRNITVLSGIQSK